MSDLPAPSFDPEQVRLEVDRILGRPEFDDDRSLIERGLDWIGEQLARLVPDGAPGGGGLSSVVTLVLVVLGIGVLALGVRALLRLRHERAAARRDPSLTVVLGAAVDPTELEAAIVAAEASGDRRSALLSRYRLLVATLIGLGVLTDQPARTTGEYRAEMADARPALAGEFSQATAAFERAFYGAADVADGDVEQMRVLMDRIAGSSVGRR